MAVLTIDMYTNSMYDLSWSILSFQKDALLFYTCYYGRVCFYYSIIYVFCLYFAGILRELRIQNVRNQFEAEEQASHQNYEVGKKSYTLLTHTGGFVHVWSC